MLESVLMQMEDTTETTTLVDQMMLIELLVSIHPKVIGATYSINYVCHILIIKSPIT